MIEPVEEAAVLSLPSFMISCTKDKVIIMRTAGPADGEGGMFDINEFDELVNQFFSEHF